MKGQLCLFALLDGVPDETPGRMYRYTLAACSSEPGSCHIHCAQKALTLETSIPVQLVPPSPSILVISLFLNAANVGGEDIGVTSFQDGHGGASEKLSTVEAISIGPKVV
jgi:hypothetical protein